MTPTTDLQKPFTDGELRALLEQYPARPPTMGGSNVSHENSYLDHYVVSAWEKKCSAILKRREDAAPTLAARVIELEAENKRLREGSRIYGLPEIPEGFGPDMHWGVPPIGESVCLSHWNRKTWFTPAVKFTDFYLHARKARAALKGGEI